MEAKKQHPTKKRTYLFSGLMRCPLCGSVLCPTYHTSRYKSCTTEYRAYRCRHKNTKCEYKQTLTEIQAEKQLLALLPELVRQKIAAVEQEAAIQKTKPKHNLAGLREKLRTLNASYMAGNKSDEDYIKEGNELKALIAEAEQESPPVERNLAPLKKLLDNDFISLYSSLTIEEKREFWRNLLVEIKLADNKIIDVTFRI